ncbi:HoxN/HupN/NixA family nickel/cobalt transporter [Pseudoclavibacter helvolus]|uniref:HoxN/HupN/NixA family nickel/cobalt transporter n=1 Tax=Pseudoclavibacter helvolus TaxID=255205 RepID=UPI0024AD7510|nr:HoxN/HupN/NixA family nickel/cobalt transporter [Pseudoclavibacter helvolus]
MHPSSNQPSSGRPGFHPGSNPGSAPSSDSVAERVGVRASRKRSFVLPVTVIVLLHVLGWGTLAFVVIPAGVDLGGGDGAAIVTLGVGLTAYALGLRHAFDADHIAAIDNTTRRLAERGKPADTVGLWFSLGHSTIVFVLCLLLTFGISAVGAALADDGSTLHAWTSVFGPTISAVFLIAIAVINIRAVRASTRSKAGGGHDSLPGGPISRLLGGFERVVDRPGRMYGVGLLFGLGFDTATEIGLLALAGSATLAAVPWWAALTLPVLFAAGMSTLDTAQGALMRRAYTWEPERRSLGRLYGTVMTGLSVVAALLIAIVQLSAVANDSFGWGGPFGWVASIGIDDLGLVLTALLLAAWAVVIVMTRGAQRRAAS